MASSRVRTRVIAQYDVLEERILLFSNGSIYSLIIPSAVQSPVHENITRGGLSSPENFNSLVLDDQSFLKNDILESIIDANVSQDTGYDSSGLYIHDPARHFDASDFDLSVGTINTYYSLAVANADPSHFTPDNVAQYFGKALHTIQDFYAHTNWVNYAGLQSTLVEAGDGFWVLQPPPGFKFLEGPLPSGESAKILATPANPTDYRVDVTDSTTHIVLYQGLVSGGFAGNNFAPVGARIDHDDLNHDHPGSLVYAARPLYIEARNLAVKQTAHEFERLGKLISDAYGKEALNKLMCAWAKTDDTSQAAFRSMWGNDLVGCATDLVLVIDTTGSMVPYIDAAKDAAKQIASQLLKDQPNSRIGVVLYKDYGMGDPYVSETLLPFTNDINVFSNAVNSISVGGGGDTPESVYSGLINAIDNQQGLGSWRGEGVGKQIIVFGDAPPHDPEPGSGYTLDSVTAEAKAGGITISSGLSAFAVSAASTPSASTDPVNISTIALGDDSEAISAFNAIAQANGGQSYLAATSSSFVSTLLAAIDQTTADNQPPVIAPIAPVTVEKGKTASFTVSATDPDSTPGGLTYSLDSESPPGAKIDPKTGVFSWTPTSDLAIVPITIHVSDAGTPPRQAIATVYITVAHVAPFVFIGPDANTTSHRVFSQDGAFSDLDAETWTGKVDYGDGSGLQSLSLNPDKTFNLSHSYSRAGIFTVTATVTDSSGQSGSDQLLITVAPSNVPPVLTGIASKTVDEGSLLSFRAVGADSDSKDTLTFSLDAGAPKGAAINPKTGVFTFTPVDGPASYTVTVRVTDNGTPALSDAKTFTIKVANVAPTVNGGSDAQLVAGHTLSHKGSFTDPGIADSFTATVNYGDGSGDQALALSADRTFALVHTYADAGTFTATVTVKDKDGGKGLEHFTVLVASPPAVIPPVVTPQINDTLDRGRVALVSTLYRDLLNRLPDTQGIGFWRAYLAAGTKARRIAFEIGNSREHRYLQRHHLAPRIGVRAALRHALQNAAAVSAVHFNVAHPVGFQHRHFPTQSHE